MGLGVRFLKIHHCWLVLLRFQTFHVQESQPEGQTNHLRCPADKSVLCGLLCIYEF